MDSRQADHEIQSHFRKVRYTDLESFGGADDFGAFTFNAATFSGNAFADLLLGLPSKSYIAQSGPDTRLHAYQTGVFAQDEWRVNRKLTVSVGLRWQALPPLSARMESSKMTSEHTLQSFHESFARFLPKRNRSGPWYLP